jgi:hypothetical protein
MTGLNAAGQRQLYVLADQDDSLHQHKLTIRGCAQHGQPIYHWQRDLEAPIPDMQLVEA